jgi:hypothetical protein
VTSVVLAVAAGTAVDTAATKLSHAVHRRNGTPRGQSCLCDASPLSSDTTVSFRQLKATFDVAVGTVENVKRYRLPIAVAVALLPLLVPVPAQAQAARGSFVYWALSPGGDPAGERHELKDPPTASCQTLAGADTSAQVIKVENDTDTPATVYESKECTGHHLVVAAKETKKAGGHGPHSFGSVKFRL